MFKVSIEFMVLKTVLEHFFLSSFEEVSEIIGSVRKSIEPIVSYLNISGFR